jgi:hypothetical protein
LPKSKSIPFLSVKGKYTSYMDEEVEARLSGDNYLREFRKMYFNDPIIGSIMLAMTKTFQSIEWKTHNDPKDALKRSLENVNWIERLEEVLLCLVYGHSVFEVVLEEDEDGLVIWKNMYSRPQDTITEWIRGPHGEITNIVQSNVNGEYARIKMSKCLHFGVHKTANRPQGRSILRNAYRDWYYRTNIEKIEAIGIERDLTGLPVLTPAEDAVLLNDDGTLNELGTWAWQIVRQIKRNEQEGLVLQPGWALEMLGSPGKRQFDLNAVIDRYDSKIAMSMLAQFLILGITNDSGSFALAKEQSDLFHKAIEGFAIMIANTINQQFIGARAISLLNDYPETAYIEPVGANKLNLNDLASFLGRLFKYNVVTPDDKLEEHVRKLASLPIRDESTSRVVQGVTDKIGADQEQVNKEDTDNAPAPKKEDEK